jgi:hypothetical protein
MIAETTETGWKRFLDRIRKLWEPTPQYTPPSPALEHEAGMHADETPRVSHR